MPDLTDRWHNEAMRNLRIALLGLVYFSTSYLMAAALAGPNSNIPLATGATALLLSMAAFLYLDIVTEGKEEGIVWGCLYILPIIIGAVALTWWIVRLAGLL